MDENLTLMEHQVKGVEFLRNRKTVALVMDRGTGKTPTVLVDCDEKITNKVVSLILYVAPLSTLENVRRECFRFARNLFPVLLVGPRVERIRRLMHKRGNIYIINPGGVRIMLPQLLEIGFDLIVMDECFVAGTPVDTPQGRKPIEQIQPGDIVFSAAGSSRVKATRRRKKNRLVRIRTSAGELVCSENHPFFTRDGWVPSSELKKGDWIHAQEAAVRMVQRNQDERSEEESLLRSILLREMETGTTGIQETDLHQGAGTAYFQENKKVGQLGPAFRNQNARQDRETETHEKPCHQSKGVGDASCHEAQAAHSGRQREAHPATSKIAMGNAGSGMDSGILRRDGKEAWTGMADPLQDRHRSPREDDRGRGGWGVSLFEKGSGQKKGSLSEGAWVESVEILEQGNPEFRRISGGKDTVTLWDLEVEGHPSFSVHGLLVHNSTRIKDRTTQIAKAMNILSMQAEWKRTLTGMPFTEGVEDAWSQFHFLDPKILNINYWAFRNRHCILKDGFVVQNGKKKKYRSIVGYKRLDEFESKVMPYIYRVAKEDCLDLPPKVYQRLMIEMTSEQKKKYLEVQKEVASEIEGREIVHAIALAKLQKCRQVAAGFLYDSNHDPVMIPCRKYQELQTLLEDSLYAQRKVVIFTSFIAEPAMVEGAVDNLPRKMRVKAFQIPKQPGRRQETVDEWEAYQEGPAVLIGNARSGGTGLNLQAADIAIFMSNDWAMEDRAQAEDRIHRMGSEKFSRVLIIDLITKDTVEEDILVALKTKRDLVEIFLERIRRKQKGEAV